MSLLLREVDFATVLPTWRDGLKLDRHGPIEPTSARLYLGGDDLLTAERYTARFFALMAGDCVGAVIGGHQSDSGSYRCRGLFVEPCFRYRGCGRVLLRAVEGAALAAGCSSLWTLPRPQAMVFYARCGFVFTGRWIWPDLEFGATCYAEKRLGLGADALAGLTAQ